MSDLSKWLNKFGSWNAKRTKTTCSIFSIPNELLCDVKADSSAVNVVQTVLQSQVSSSEDRGRTCRACNLTFAEQSEQQQHFKCELHRINLKRSLVGLEPLDSLAGTESSNTQNITNAVGRVHFAEEADQSSSDEDDDEDLIYSAENDMDTDNYEDAESEESNISKSYTTEDGVARKYISKQDGPQYLFSPQKDALWDISVSVGALHDTVNSNPYEIEPWTLLSKAVQRIQDNSGSMWCVLILRSGRFAGAVFDSHTVLTHKVLRRYTVRAKAGGSQSSHDGQGKNAKSVGAMLRRYGEQALTEDVRAILKDWSAHIQSCSSVFLSCPKTMRSVIFEEGLKDKDTPLKRTDPRIRLVPFMVKKPTFEEVKLVHTRLSTVTFLPRGSSEDATLPVAQGAPVGKTAFNTEAKVPEIVPTVPQLPYCRASKNLFAACLGGDLDVIKALLADINGDHSVVGTASDATALTSAGTTSAEEEFASGIAVARIEEEGSSERESEVWDLKDVLNMPESFEDMSTCLHLASERGLAAVVFLLLTAGADPTRLDVRGRPPYFLAKTKDVRDAFRKARATSEEEMLKQQKDKEKEKKKRSKDKKKQQEAQDILDSAQAEAALAQQKAAMVQEGHNRKVMAGVCAQCERSLFNIKSLDVFDRRCCSSACVLLLRRKLAAEAAENRFATKSS